MLKKTNLKNKTMALLAALCMAGMLASCAAAPAEVYRPVADEPVAASESGSVDTEPTEPVESVETVEADDSDDVDAPDESSVHSDTADADVFDPVRYLHDIAYHDEMLAVNELGPRLAGLLSKPETDTAYCTVDMRQAHESYDVDWDYGTVYDSYVRTADWSKVFDADYYMDAFPMLALQYHYDEEQLLRHFQTVGIHEGRQGCEGFNVGAYIEWCDANLPYTADAFQGDYALYYLFYAQSWGEHPDSFPADGRPAQYKTVMTKSQKEELDGINAYRAKVGADPLVFDPELAAVANFRAWTNQDEALVGHDWLHDSKNQSLMDTMFEALDADKLGENALETSSTVQRKPWSESYATSESHYEAMVRTTYRYCGPSNLYVDSVAFRNSSYRGVQFDMFVPDLSTAMNP